MKQSTAEEFSIDYHSFEWVYLAVDKCQCIDFPHVNLGMAPGSTKKSKNKIL